MICCDTIAISIELNPWTAALNPFEVLTLNKTTCDVRVCFSLGCLSWDHVSYFTTKSGGVLGAEVTTSHSRGLRILWVLFAEFHSCHSVFLTGTLSVSVFVYCVYFEVLFSEFIMNCLRCFIIIYCIRQYFRVQIFSRIWPKFLQILSSREFNFAILVVLSLVQIDMNQSRVKIFAISHEVVREIREN